MEKYTIISEVGRGAFGIVWKAQNKETKEIVAIKQMLQEYETWDECINLRELKSLRKLQHVNIIKLKEVFRVKKQLSFVFEYVEKNIYKLYERAKEDGATQLSDTTIKLIVYQIASALAYMHKHGFFHRDLKPENLLITTDNVVKLIDLGLAREIRSRPPFTDYVSTRWYRAPEILLRSTAYNSPVDVFALACIMAELYLMKPLFNGSSEIDQIQKITSVLGTPSKTDWPEGYMLASQKHFTFPSYPTIPLSQVIPNCPPDGINLLNEMMRWDPSKRITPTKILSHPYFNGIELPDEIKNADSASGTTAASNTQSSSSSSSAASSDFSNNPNAAQSQSSLGSYSQSMNRSANYGQAGGSSNYNNNSNSNTFESGSYHNKGASSFSNSSNQFQGSTSPDQRFQQNHRSQSDMGALKGYENNASTSNQNKQGYSSGIFGSNQNQSGLYTSKKNLDPIYEFINKDMGKLNINSNSTSSSSSTVNNNTNNPPRFTSSMNSQQLTSKQKLEDNFDELEQEILGTYLPTSSASTNITSVSRIRQPNSNTNNMNAPSSSMFGSDTSGLNQPSSSIYSPFPSQQTNSRISANRDNGLGIGMGMGGGYVPSAASRSTGNDIYNFDGIKNVNSTGMSSYNNNNNNANSMRSPNLDIYNFDNIIPSNIRKQ